MPNFTKKFLDELRDRVSLVDVISKKVALKHTGKNYTGLCPFHNEKTSSFHVIDDDHYHCFGCGAHGDAITFMMHANNYSFVEAIERLAQDVGLEIPKDEFSQDPKKINEIKEIYKALELSAQFFQKQLKANMGKNALDYLKKRGLSEDIINKFRIGFASNEMDDLYLYLREYEIDREIIKKAGLIKEKDGKIYNYFFNRVMFPILDKNGRVIAFGGRVLDDGVPKYLNSAETPVFHKGGTLYGLSHAREMAYRKREIIVVEGYMDVIALSNAGFENAVAPLGTAVTERQIEVLWKLSDEPVLCFDGDNAGQKAAYRAAERVIPILRPGKSLKFAVLPEGLDPDDLIKSQGKESFSKFLEKSIPLSDVIYRNLTLGKSFKTPEEKAGLDKAFLKLTNQINDKNLRWHYLKFLRDKTRYQYKKTGNNDNKSVVSSKNVIYTSLNSDLKMLLAYVILFPKLSVIFLEELIRIRLNDKVLDDYFKDVIAKLEENHNHTFETIKPLLSDKLMDMLRNEFAIIRTKKATMFDAEKYLKKQLLHFNKVELEKEITNLEQEMKTEPSQELWQKIFALKEELQNIQKSLEKD